MIGRRKPLARFADASRTRPLVLGHRGARHAAPENTLRAFELSRLEGADGVELDVRLSKNGEVIVLHDPSLERVSGGANRQRAQDLDAAELARVDVGEGEGVPRLADVLDWATRFDLCVNVEVKTDVPDRQRLVRAVADLLGAHQGSEERILLSSFGPDVVLMLARRLPSFGVAWLIHDRQKLWRLASRFRWLGAVGVNPQHTLLSTARVQSLKQRGALVSTWTVNDPVLAKAYARFGVDAIISDCPGEILAGLG